MFNIILFLFGFPAFATFDYSSAELCNKSEPLCEVGFEPRYLIQKTHQGAWGSIRIPSGEPTAKEICVCRSTNNSCPSDSTRIKHPIPLVDSIDEGGIDCGDLPYSYYRRTTKGTSVAEWSRTSRIWYQEKSDGPLRHCHTKILVPKSKLTDDSDCQINGPVNIHKRIRGDNVEMAVHIPCPYNESDHTCKKLLIDFLQGKTSINPDGARRNSNQDGKDVYGTGLSHCYVTGSMNQHTVGRGTPEWANGPKYAVSSGPSWSPGQQPSYACSRRLVETNNTRNFIADLTFYGSRESSIVGMGTSGRVEGGAGPLSNLQCISDNTRFTSTCKCNDTDYEFDMDQAGSCTCPDGTPKEADGSCPDHQCPPDSVPAGGKCVCSYPCPDGKGKFTYQITPANPAPACPSPAPDPPEGGACTPLPSNLCPNELPASDPKYSSHVTVESGPLREDQKCPDGGRVKKIGGVEYCVTDQTCEDNTGGGVSCTDVPGTSGETLNCVNIGIKGQWACADNKFFSAPQNANCNVYGTYKYQPWNLKPDGCDPKPGATTNPCTSCAGGRVFKRAVQISGRCPGGWREFRGYAGHSISHTMITCSPPRSSSYNGKSIMVSAPEDIFIMHESRNRGPDGRGMCSNLNSFPYLNLDISKPVPDEAGCNSGVSRHRLHHGRREAYEVCATPISDSVMSNATAFSDITDSRPNPNITGDRNQYICDNGETPSSQDADCECRGTEKGCPDGYIKEAEEILGSCDCPSGFSRDGGPPDGSCFKPPGRGTTVTKEALYSPGLGTDSVLVWPADDPDIPLNLQGAESIGAICNDISGSTRRSSHYTEVQWNCFMDIVQKTCPGLNGGIYNSTKDKCETACTQQQSVSSCKCIPQNSSCGCEAGWDPYGNNKCRKRVASQAKKCKCSCYKGEKENYIFETGSREYESFDSAKCTEVSDTEPDKCCLTCDKPCCDQGVKHANCTVSDPDGVCPCPDGSRPSSGKVCCPAGGVSLPGTCPSSTTVEDPQGIDMVFGRTGASSYTSIYSIGSIDRPDYICWERNEAGTLKVQRRDLLCPSRRSCMNSKTGLCKCHKLGSSGSGVSTVVENTYCEYASLDPMKFEEGVVREDIPLTRGSDKYEDDLRFSTPTTVVAP